MVDRMDDHERDREQAGDNDGSVREITSVKSDAPTLHPPPKGKTLPVNPLLVPPPSVHDAYVSKIIQPMAPPDLPPTQPPSPAAVDRPPIFRTASAPAPNPNNPRKLLPSPLPSKPVKKVEDGTPIFEIFDADLSEPASEMVKALKGHLEGVLRVQEEIGRMHLTLEKLTVVGQGSWEDFEPSSPQAGTRGTTKEAPRRKSQAETPGSVESEGSRRGSKGTAEMGQAGGDTPGSKAKKVEAEQALLKREQEVDEIMSKVRRGRVKAHGSLGRCLNGSEHIIPSEHLDYPFLSPMLLLQCRQRFSPFLSLLDRVPRPNGLYMTTTGRFRPLISQWPISEDSTCL